MRKTSVKGFHSGPHQHPFYELGVVLSGQCTWTLGKRKKLLLSREEMLLLPPGTVHQEDAEGEAAGRVMWVGFENPDQDLSGVALKKLEACDIEHVAHLLRVVEREWNSPEPAAGQMASKAMEMLLLLMQRSLAGPHLPVRKKTPLLNDRQRRIVDSARSYFEQNTAIPRSVEQIARYHSLSVSHFSSLFRKGLGLGPREFVQKLRLKETSLLLKETDKPLKEIARLYGYVDAAHFCRHFKKEIGLTPGQFRRKKRG